MATAGNPTPDTENLTTKKNYLIEDLRNRANEMEAGRRANRRLHSFLVIGAMVAGAVAAGTGFAVPATDASSTVLAILAGSGGAAVALFRGLEQALRPDERADFYRVLRSECRNLMAAVRYFAPTQKEFLVLVKKYESLNTRAATKLPRGQGMQSVKLFYEELESTGKVEVPRAHLEQA